MLRYPQMRRNTEHWMGVISCRVRIAYSEDMPKWLTIGLTYGGPKQWAPSPPMEMKHMVSWKGNVSDEKYWEWKVLIVNHKSFHSSKLYQKLAIGIFCRPFLFWLGGWLGQSWTANSAVREILMETRNCRNKVQFVYQTELAHSLSIHGCNKVPRCQNVGIVQSHDTLKEKEHARYRY